MATNKFFPKVVEKVLPITPVVGVVSTCMLVASAVAQCAPGNTNPLDCYYANVLFMVYLSNVKLSSVRELNCRFLFCFFIWSVGWLATSFLVGWTSLRCNAELWQLKQLWSHLLLDFSWQNCISSSMVHAYHLPFQLFGYEIICFKNIFLDYVWLYVLNLDGTCGSNVGCNLEIHSC